MTDKADDVCLLTDGEDDGGSASPTPATVPKKRGRPSKPNKAKILPPSGRGRGRPAKGEVSTPFKKSGKAAVADGSADEEGTASDGGSPLPNGDEAVASSGRGRPSKGKRKAAHAIESTGKGRGRPKKSQKSDAVDDEEEEGNDDNEEEESSDYKPNKKTTPKKSGGKKGRGRPTKKSENSDDESSDDKVDEDEERHSAGRPASGGVNLNISRTGRGQGRPKVAAKRTVDSENGSDSPKKRGRPSSSAPIKGPYIPTGKPRGRPKTSNEKEEDEEDDDVEEKPSKDAENSDDDGDNKVNSDSADE